MGTDDHGAFVVLQCAGDDLGRRRRTTVDQDHQRDGLDGHRQVLQWIVLVAAQVVFTAGDVLALGILGATIRGHDRRLRRQEDRRDTDSGIEQTTRIVAQVEYQAFDRLRLAVLADEHLFQVANHVRRRFFLELGNTQVAISRLDDLGLDALNLDLVPGEREVEQLRLALTGDGQLDGGLRLAAHLLDCIGQRQALDRRVVDLDDQIAGLDTRAIGGRILYGGHHFDEAVLGADFDTQTAELALRADLQILERVGVQIGGVRVEVGQHAADGKGNQLLVVDRLDIALFDGAEDIGKGAQLLDR